MLDPKPVEVLIVDDDDSLREVLTLILEDGGFKVKSAADVCGALKLIGSQSFDVLLSDLHMPYAGDGLTVVSAMRHTNPKAITIIFSAYPELKMAAAAIMAQTDAIIVKPAAVGNLVELIREKLKTGTTPPRAVSSVATILEEETSSTIADWLQRVDRFPNLVKINMDDQERSAHLPQLFRDLVFRLRNPHPMGTHALVSPAAAKHGIKRREQGYTPAMIVEESRMLQVSIFQTLQSNLNRIDFSRLLIGVMEIADEVDCQLAQTMASYITESHSDSLPMTA